MRINIIIINNMGMLIYHEQKQAAIDRNYVEHHMQRILSMSTYFKSEVNINPLVNNILHLVAANGASDEVYISIIEDLLKINKDLSDVLYNNLTNTNASIIHHQLQ